MNKPPLMPNVSKLNDSLPPPHWSPTGENGYWVWRDEKWLWLSDEEYRELKTKEL